MRVGLIARAEDRGLGLQTHEFHRAMAPDHTVVVDMGSLAKGFPPHFDRYPGAEVTTFAEHHGFVDRAPVLAMLEACDVVYTAETFYDPLVPVWAAERGCTVVVHVNPEFHRGAEGFRSLAWWAPTPWRLEHLPASTRVVPVPVAGDRFPLAAAPEHDGPMRVLHSVGHRAGQDRNGTLAFLRAIRKVRRPLHVTLATQDDRLPLPQGLPAHVTVEARTGGVAEYWRVYEGQDVLVLPRRYGGLCLPVQEAMASGLAVVLPDVSPNDSWPALLTGARQLQDMATPGGTIRLADANPIGIAAALDSLAADPVRLRYRQGASAGWARGHTWEALRPLYVDELARACAG